MQSSVFILTVIFAIIASNAPQIDGKSNQSLPLKSFVKHTHAHTYIYARNVTVIVTLTAHVYVRVRNALQEME